MHIFPIGGIYCSSMLGVIQLESSKKRLISCFACFNYFYEL